MLLCVTIFLLSITFWIMLFPWLKSFGSFTVERLIPKSSAVAYKAQQDRVPTCFPSLPHAALAHCSLPSSYHHPLSALGTGYNWTPVSFPPQTLAMLFSFNLVWCSFYSSSCWLSLLLSQNVIILNDILKEVSLCHLERLGPSHLIIV